MLAVVNLYERVSSFLISDGVPAVSMFGWRIPAQHPYGNRYAWIPGDQSGALGAMGPPRNPGGSPRSLGTLNETFTVLINGYDPTDPENELAQYKVCRYLYDALFRGIYRFAYGAFAVRYEQWVTPRAERRHGAALRVVCELQATVPDLPWSGDLPYTIMPPPPLSADILVSLLDVDEHVVVSSQIEEAVTYLGDPVTYLGEPVTVFVDA